MSAAALPHTVRPSPLRRLTDLASLIATPLRPSHYLELVNPLWTTHVLQARVEAVWDETADARTLTLRPGRNWRVHRAGQHVRVGLAIQGRHYTRTYSLSSSPDRADGLITLTVKAMADGRVSRALVRDLRPGDYLPIGLPQGDFVLPDATPVRPLFITAGSGITPVMSMLRTAALRAAMPDAVHIHYAPHARDAIFGRELAQFESDHPNYSLQLVQTRDGAPGASRPHFSAAQLEALCPDWRDRDAWACGPQALLDAVETHFDRAGRRSRLHVERFRAAVAPAAADAAGGTVRFLRSGVQVQADGLTPLLRVAEDAGLNPQHGCRMGICHSCDATLTGGCVRDLRTGALIREPGTRVQVCVCAAAGPADLEL